MASEPGLPLLPAGETLSSTPDSSRGWSWAPLWGSAPRRLRRCNFGSGRLGSGETRRHVKRFRVGALALTWAVTACGANGADQSTELVAGRGQLTGADARAPCGCRGLRSGCRRATDCFGNLATRWVGAGHGYDAISDRFRHLDPVGFGCPATRRGRPACSRRPRPQRETGVQPAAGWSAREWDDSRPAGPYQRAPGLRPQPRADRASSIRPRSRVDP